MVVMMMMMTMMMIQVMNCRNKNSYLYGNVETRGNVSLV